MDCENMEEMLSAYLDGELDSEKQMAVEQHMATCSACRFLLDEYKEISSLVHSEFVVVSAPFDLEANVLSQIGAYEEKRQAKRAGAAGLVGAMLLLGIIVAVSLSPAGVALLSIIRLIVRVVSNLLPLLWHQIGNQGLLTAGVVSVGTAVTIGSLFAMKKMMKTFAPGK